MKTLLALLLWNLHEFYHCILFIIGKDKTDHVCVSFSKPIKWWFITIWWPEVLYCSCGKVWLRRKRNYFHVPKAPIHPNCRCVVPHITNIFELMIKN